jgi:hypothetical protein
VFNTPTKLYSRKLTLCPVDAVSQMPKSESRNQALVDDDPFVTAFGKVDDSQIRVRKKEGDSVTTGGTDIDTGATHGDTKDSMNEDNMFDARGYNIDNMKSEALVQERHLTGSAAGAVIPDGAAHVEGRTLDVSTDNGAVSRGNAFESESGRQHMPVIGSDDERGNLVKGTPLPSDVNDVLRGEGHTFGSAPFAPTQSPSSTDPNASSDLRISANAVSISALRSWPVIVQNPFTDNRGAFPVNKMVGFAGHSMQSSWTGVWAQTPAVAVHVAETVVHKPKLVASDDDENYDDDEDEDEYNDPWLLEEDRAGWKEVCVCVYTCVFICMHVCVCMY